MVPIVGLLRLHLDIGILDDFRPACRVRRNDGGEFPVEIGLNPVNTPDGVKAIYSIVDVSARKAMEMALR